MTEAELQDLIRVAVSAAGGVVWRNNVGVLIDRRGVPVRYGLANDSPALNKQYASADLIGWTPDGRFLSIEVKALGGRVTEAQERWRALVASRGGVAVVARSIEDVLGVLV